MMPDLPEDVGVPKQPVQQATPLAVRAQLAYITSIVAAIANGVAAYWHPWQIAIAAVFIGSAVVWHRVNRRARE